MSKSICDTDGAGWRTRLTEPALTTGTLTDCEAVGPIRNGAFTLIATEADTTLTAAQMLTGLIIVVLDADRDITTPTATLLSAALPNVAVGESVDLGTFVNAAATDLDATLVGGTDVTLIGTAVVLQSASVRLTAARTAETTWSLVIT